MHMNRLFFLFFFSCASLCVHSQNLFEKDSSIPISETSVLQNAYAGGINTAQFSDIDIDDDGFQDLVIFDKSDEKLLTFINDGIVGTASYTYAPEYEEIFPRVRSWILLEDYDGDGLEDIFTHNISGIKVYKTSRVAGQLNFEVVVNTCRYTSQAGNPVNVFVSGVDVPAFTDVNADGDMDILTFDQFGGTVEWYENQDVESGGTIDSLYFEKVDECWGNFFEDNDTNAVDLGVICRAAGDMDIIYDEKVHAGSTLLAYDMDGDLDKELMLGDISFPFITQLTNGGDVNDANMTEQDPLFPVYDTTADIFVFPSMFRLDVDNDDIQDLIISTNDRPFSENYKNVWFYKNITDDINPMYELQTTEFLTDGNVDVGQSAKPAFVDVDGDMDLDLLIGNLGYFNRPTVTLKSTLTYYENVGDSTAAEFVLVDRDFNNLSQFGILGVYPDFGDIDADGDMDMVWGDEEGYIHIMENTAGPGAMMNLSLVMDSLADQDYGKRIQPLLKDVNGDDLPDLICGERAGGLYYFKNSTQNGNIEFSEVTDTWGDVNVQPVNAIFGFSAPLIVPIDTSGREVLLVANMIGEVSIYDSLHLSSFVKVDSFFLDSLDYVYYGQSASNLSRFSGFDMADLNHDNKWELLAGRERGGINLFTQTSEYAFMVEEPVDTSDTIDAVIEIIPDMQIYPNPSSDIIYMISAHLIIEKVVLYNLEGKLLSEKNTTANTVNVSDLAKGIYFIEVHTSKGVLTEKFIKN